MMIQEKEEDWDPELELGNCSNDEGERQQHLEFCAPFLLLALPCMIMALNFLMYEWRCRSPI